jgi:hypothetical protein
MATVLAEVASAVASRAESALRRTVAVSCSIADAASSRLEACSAGGNLVRARRDGVAAQAHLADDARQALVHGIQRLEQLAGFVAAADFHGGGQITGRDRLGQLNGLGDRPGDGARQQEGNAHRENDGDHGQQHHQPLGAAGHLRRLGAEFLHAVDLRLRELFDRIQIAALQRQDVGHEQRAPFVDLTGFHQADHQRFLLLEPVAGFHQHLERRLAALAVHRRRQLVDGRRDHGQRGLELGDFLLHQRSIGHDECGAHRAQLLVDFVLDRLGQPHLDEAVVQDDFGVMVDGIDPGHADHGQQNEQRDHRTEAQGQPHSYLQIAEERHDLPPTQWVRSEQQAGPF